MSKVYNSLFYKGLYDTFKSSQRIEIQYVLLSIVYKLIGMLIEIILVVRNLVLSFVCKQRIFYFSQNIFYA